MDGWTWQGEGTSAAVECTSADDEETVAGLQKAWGIMSILWKYPAYFVHYG